MNVRALLPVWVLVLSAACGNARREASPAGAPGPTGSASPGAGGAPAAPVFGTGSGAGVAPAQAQAQAQTPALSADWDRGVCDTMQRLCGGEGSEFQQSQCLQQAGDLRRNLTPRLALETSSCVAQSETCAAAAGCITGGALRGVGGQFLVGFGSAMSR